MPNKILPIIILSLLFGGVALAQNDNLPDPGMTPDSPFYFLERAAEAVGTFFTIGDVNKAARYANLAAERLAEAKAVAEKSFDKAPSTKLGTSQDKKTELVKKTLERYENHLLKAQLRIERAAAKGENAEEVVQVVNEAAQKHFAVLEKVLEKAPEEAKPAIRHAMIVSTKEGREVMVETSEEGGISNEGRLGEFCKEQAQKQGTSADLCEKIPLEGFESFEALGAFCIEAGGPPDTCPSIEAKCKELGVATPDECFRVLSGARIESIPVSEGEEEQSGLRLETSRNFEVFYAKCLESGAPEDMCQSVVKDMQSSKSFRTICMEKGGTSEICDKFPDKRFESFEEVKNFCVEMGGPADMCSTLESTCKEFGVTSPNECLMVLSIASFTTMKVVPAQSLGEEEQMQMQQQRIQVAPESQFVPEQTQGAPAEKTLKQRYVPGASKVVIYFLPSCPHCIKAKAWMDQHSIEYEAIDVSELKAAGEELTVRTGGSGVPTVVMDGQILIGFTEERYSEFFGVE